MLKFLEKPNSPPLLGILILSRTKFVNFVVTDFDGTYHAILGRPSLTKFMAVPHYLYLVLKIPTEKGLLTVRGNVYTA